VIGPANGPANGAEVENFFLLVLQSSKSSKWS
jgi:hypothetical protein